MTMTSNDFRAQYRSHENPKPKRPRKTDDEAINDKLQAEAETAAMLKAWATWHQFLEPENRPMMIGQFEFAFASGAAFARGEPLAAEHGPGPAR
jgi:hypothetical protein